MVDKVPQNPLSRIFLVIVPKSNDQTNKVEQKEYYFKITNDELVLDLLGEFDKVLDDPDT